MLTFYFRKNHYLVRAVDEKIFLLQQSGLIDYWTYIYDEFKRPRGVEEIGPKVMSLYDLSGIFKVWMFGLLISAGVFVTEIVGSMTSRVFKTYLLALYLRT